MSVLRHTQNFTFYVNDILGKGATATVYRGIHNRNGEEVAVKVFSEENHLLPRIKTEFELLRKLDHENIVRIIGVEAELLSGRDVLIMELCRGLNLFEILKQPQFLNGFEEKEFLVVLKHLAAGVRHMREKNIVHRDMKPGNIVKHIGENGVAIYKIADFGTARELSDGEEFVTLCGTEAYLHPNIFAKAFKNKIPYAPNNPCVSNVDIWSIGVSLFHIASGFLPFRASSLSERDEKIRTMYKIITKKESGVVYGHQSAKNGEILWRKELPDTCLLSPSLRKLITPLIAGLLENDEIKVWSFEDFFSSVDKILSHKPYHLFYVNMVKDSLLYLPPNSSLVDLKRFINEETNIPLQRQLLVYNGRDDFSLEDVSTTEDSPIFVIDYESIEIKASIADVVKRFPATYPDFKQIVSNQTSLALQWTSNAYSIKRSVDKCAQQTKVIHLLVDNISKLLEIKVRIAEKNEHSCCVIFNSSKKMFDYMKEVACFAVDICHSKTELEFTSNCISKAAADVTKLTIQLNDISRGIEQLNEKIASLKEPWKSHEVNDLSTVGFESNNYCEQLCSMVKCIELHAYMRDMRLLNLDKLKYERKFIKLYKLLHETCLPSIHYLTMSFEDWFPKAMSAFEIFDWTSKRMNNFTKDLVELQRSFTVIKEEQKRMLNSAKQIIDKEKEEKSAKNLMLKQLLDNCIDSNEKLSTQIEETENLVDKFDSLSF